MYDVRGIKKIFKEIFKPKSISILNVENSNLIAIPKLLCKTLLKSGNSINTIKG